MWSDRLITDSQFVSPRKDHKTGCVFMCVRSFVLPPFWHSFPFPRYAPPSHCLSFSVHILYGFFQFIYILHCLHLVLGRFSGLIISHRHTRSTSCFVLVSHILLYLSHFTNDTNCRGFRGKVVTFGAHHGHEDFLYIGACARSCEYVRVWHVCFDHGGIPQAICIGPVHLRNCLGVRGVLHNVLDH